MSKMKKFGLGLLAGFCSMLLWNALGHSFGLYGADGFQGSATIIFWSHVLSMVSFLSNRDTYGFTWKDYGEKQLVASGVLYAVCLIFSYAFEKVYGLLNTKVFICTFAVLFIISMISFYLTFKPYIAPKETA